MKATVAILYSRSEFTDLMSNQAICCTMKMIMDASRESHERYVPPQCTVSDIRTNETKPANKIPVDHDGLPGSK